MKWAEHVASMGCMRNTKFWSENPGDLGIVGRIILEKDFTEMKWEIVDWMYLAQH
jgi:hypothetical protein